MILSLVEHVKTTCMYCQQAQGQMEDTLYSNKVMLRQNSRRHLVLPWHNLKELRAMEVFCRIGSGRLLTFQTAPSTAGASSEGAPSESATTSELLGHMSLRSLFAGDFSISSLNLSRVSDKALNSLVSLTGISLPPVFSRASITRLIVNVLMSLAG